MWSMLGLILVAAPAPTLRMAVVVGSNQAVEGRAALRYAHGDARDVAEVLQVTGHFAKDDVALLLDASPDQVLAAVSSAAARAKEVSRPALFVFYYSGHADDRALYPGGAPLELAKLKASLEDPAFEVRVGIIDSCRGGGWTQAKGLSPAAPFEVTLPALASEGTALLAASSGLEDAHETEALRGSFFTHHLVAGLRGAADHSGDGQVTLSEAFAYADRLTIRDTASASPQPQHPSFDMRLRGRQDVVLADVGGSPTVLTVAQTEGPLQLVQLSTGVVLVEATPGEQLLRIALPPGSYLVRRLTAQGVRAREVLVSSGQLTRVDETSLTLVGEPSLVSKGSGPGLGSGSDSGSDSLQGTHTVSLAGGALPDAYFVTWSLQAMYRWRFASAFGLRVRGLLGLPVATALSEELIRDFGVLATAFAVKRFAVGADVEWLAWSGQQGPVAITLGVSLGLSAIGLGANSSSSLIAIRPAATATATVGLHLMSVPELAVFVEGLVHVGQLSVVGAHAPSASAAALPQVNLGLAWHFR